MKTAAITFPVLAAIVLSSAPAINAASWICLFVPGKSSVDPIKEKEIDDVM